MWLHRVIKSIPYHGICGRKLRYRMNATTWHRLSFYRDSLFIEAYSSTYLVLLPWLLYFFVLFLTFLKCTWGYKKLICNIVLFAPAEASYKFLRYALCLSWNHVPSRTVVIVITFSGHIFYLKGLLVSSDLGAVWSAAFIVYTGGDSPIKGTFVYLSVSISMHKSGQARRFIALPNVVKRSPRDTHREAGSFRS